jgi:hypothetical protein
MLLDKIIKCRPQTIVPVEMPIAKNVTPKGFGKILFLRKNLTTHRSRKAAARNGDSGTVLVQKGVLLPGKFSLSLTERELQYAFF